MHKSIYLIVNHDSGKTPLISESFKGRTMGYLSEKKNVSKILSIIFIEVKNKVLLLF